MSVLSGYIVVVIQLKVTPSIELHGIMVKEQSHGMMWSTKSHTCLYLGYHLGRGMVNVPDPKGTFR